jgi:pimeloyl-ACP methyl ester carboxylesterase
MPQTELLNGRITAWENPLGFAGVERLTYPIDGGEDWALAWPGTHDAWVVHLHGHGSTGDQIFTRADIREAWLAAYRRLGFGVLSANLRGNAWMCPAAAADLHRLLARVREAYGVEDFLFVSGSMGGTANLIYSMLHPEDVRAMVALCPATDIGAYARWCRLHPGGVIDEIYAAIVNAYGGTPEERLAVYAAHSAAAHAARLTMPLFVCHGDDDRLIPVEESRRLAAALAGVPTFTYLELPGGHHDSPLLGFEMGEWLEKYAG